jgi:hypothetical protein
MISACGDGAEIVDFAGLSFHVPLNGLCAACSPEASANTISKPVNERICFPSCESRTERV